jgi:hypothetical protein
LRKKLTPKEVRRKNSEGRSKKSEFRRKNAEVRRKNSEFELVLILHSYF